MQFRELNYSGFLITERKNLIAILHWEIWWHCPLASLYALFISEIQAQLMDQYVSTILSNSWEQKVPGFDSACSDDGWQIWIQVEEEVALSID